MNFGRTRVEWVSEAWKTNEKNVLTSTILSYSVYRKASDCERLRINNVLVEISLLLKNFQNIFNTNNQTTEPKVTTNGKHSPFVFHYEN